jgi:hypothetical protein
MKNILTAFEIVNQNADTIDEEELLEILKLRIEQLLETNPGFLFTVMYRMDIAESKVQFALSPYSQDQPGLALSKLIIERQRLRNKTKSEYKQPPLKDWQ